MRRVLLSLILLLALAGCAGPSSVRPPGAAHALAAAADDAPARVVGTVQSKLGLPVADAEVLLEPVKLETLTDANGGFEYASLPAGAYRLHVSKLGFAVHEHALQLDPGSLTEVQIFLAVVEEPPQPLVETAVFEGFLQCSTNAGYASSACGTVFGTSDDHTTVVLDRSREPQEVLLELVWTPTTPLTGQALELDVCGPDGTSSGLHCADAAVEDEFHRSASGTSPLSLSILVESVPGGLATLDAWVGNGRLSPYPALAQGFTLYATICYTAKCPDGFTAVPN